jgi:hypothetical protein
MLMCSYHYVLAELMIMLMYSKFLKNYCNFCLVNLPLHLTWYVVAINSRLSSLISLSLSLSIIFSLSTWISKIRHKSYMIKILLISQSLFELQDSHVCTYLIHLQFGFCNLHYWTQLAFDTKSKAT